MVSVGCADAHMARVFVDPDKCPFLKFQVSLAHFSRPAQAGICKLIKTLPNAGWFGYFRLYGPTETYFDGTWRLPGHCSVDVRRLGAFGDASETCRSSRSPNMIHMERRHERRVEAERGRA